MFLDEVGGFSDDPRIEDRFALGVVKRRDWNTPRALARDAPVGARCHRTLDPVASPAGEPVDALDGGECLVAKTIVIDVDKPLVHRTENHRCFATPTVRVAMLVPLLEGQLVVSLEHLDDGVVGFAFAFALEDLFADELV